VTQQQYDEAIQLVDSYQTQLHDLELAQAKLESQNARLKAQLSQAEVQTLEAGMSPNVQARMSELQRMLENLGRPPGDIERFDVEGGYVFMIQDKVLFASGSAELNPAGRSALLGLAQKIRSSSHGRIFVRGHTDNVPVKKAATLKRFPHGNLQLSAERAVSVAALLINEGSVDARDVVVNGYGQWEPLAPNDNADNKRLNRRVEIFVADATE